MEYQSSDNHLKMKKIILFFILIGFNSLDIHAQKTKKVNLLIQYQFEKAELSDWVRLISLIPADIDHRQQIDSISFSIPPDTVYFAGDNKYAEFILSPPIPRNIFIGVHATLNNGDYNTMAKLKPNEDFDSVQDAKYLKPELHIDSDHPDIIDQAQKLIGKTDAATARKIYHFVHNNVTYGEYLPQPQGSITTLNTRKGDCTDFTHLMVALCRANNIPAKAVYGITSPHHNTPKHEWAEIYLTGIGWICFDPTLGNNAGFKTMSNHYIYLAPGGQDEEILKQSYYYRYYYRGANPVVQTTYLVGQ